MARKNKKREAGSGSITKRKDGRWQGQYVSGYDPETGKPRRHTIYGKTQKEVAEKLRAATSSIDNGTFQEPRKITIAEYAAEYMTTHVATLTDSTQRSYEKNLRPNWLMRSDLMIQNISVLASRKSLEFYLLNTSTNL